LVMSNLGKEAFQVEEASALFHLDEEINFAVLARGGDRIPSFSRMCGALLSRPSDLRP
jgi:hypothetical protein